MEKRALVVTTEYKGVFFGYGEPKLGNTEIELEKARMVIFWSAETKGVLGLAAIGVQPGSRVTPAVSKLMLNRVTAVMVCSPEATKQWEKGLWH